MTTSAPLLSIIVPVYNASATLPRMLRSLEHIAHVQRHWVEVIAVDDGSADDSLAILRDAEQRAKPFVLRVESRAHRGAAAARNTALSLAGGEWIFFLDADDELSFDPCDFLAQAAEETCFGFSVEYRRRDRVLSRVRPVRIEQESWADVLTARNPFQPSSLLFRRACIERPFCEEIAFVEDWLFWVSNLKIFERMRVRPKITSAIIHLHEHNTSRHLASAGRNRMRVAEIIEQMYRPRLTRRNRNNLLLQANIGKLQQRHWVPLSTFLRFPCAVDLYGKLWVYALSAVFGLRPTPYRASTRSRPPE